MRKQVFGRKLKRDANERKALLKGLMNDLVLKERIKTTEEKAKAIRGGIEKLITKAKVKGNDAKSLLQPYLSAEAVKKVLQDLCVRFAKRPGGYTRIIKLGKRFGDNAKMAVIEWVEGAKVSKETNEFQPKADRPLDEKEEEKVEATVVKGATKQSRSEATPKQSKKSTATKKVTAKKKGKK